mgnify:CR=1 FL=1
MITPIPLKKIRLEYGMTVKVFNRMIEDIRDELISMNTNGNKKTKRKNPRLRTLSPRQAQFIRAFLGKPE